MKFSISSRSGLPKSPAQPPARGFIGAKAAAVLLATMLLAASGVTAANASEESPAAQNDHAMGSTIRGHESAGQLFSIQATESAFAMPGVPGMDVSSHQGVVDWTKAAANGAKFAYVKASEGTEYSNPYFADQYAGAASAGMLRGAYHFALPNASSGAAQASYFLQSGAAWTPDGKTLPALLDLEYNPYGSTCYGMTPGEMVSWVSDFATTILSRTGRLPAIYTTTDWWNTCTGKANGFGNHPLHIARWESTPGALPAGWNAHTLWQYADSGVFPGDQNVFNGTVGQLTAFASNPGPIFSDISGGQFTAEVNWLGSRGISTGWTEANGARNYRPLAPVARDAMAAFMYRLAGSPAFTAPAKSPFTDVATTNPFYKQITWLASKGISTGWIEANGTKTYRPFEPVARDAMAAFMYRLAGSPEFNAPAESPFTDVATTNPFYKQITWLASSGISSGWTEADGTKTYRPFEPVARDAMAAFMSRFDTKFGDQ
ncbi:lysozyme [Paenarthrobacter nitroguajacolicus]|uniref:GH25 family lysozyme n=1 Tax=Paenarthrobacter nitroguajacolicus TaxID=211146 RepID=UPI0015BA50A5|nr:GH25 family lysozyme [Paenarthrobacter nitroguajacolicus]NWL11705.1 lysozyme [Paenarthrobacter nitroguajacolicus]